MRLFPFKPPVHEYVKVPVPPVPTAAIKPFAKPQLDAVGETEVILTAAGSVKATVEVETQALASVTETV